MTLGPDGTAYVGVLGGIVAVRDKVPPPQPGAPRRPALSLTGSCARGKVTVALGGADAGLVRRVRFTANAKRVGRDTRAPFGLTFPLRAHARSRASPRRSTSATGARPCASGQCAAAAAG